MNRTAHQRVRISLSLSQHIGHIFYCVSVVVVVAKTNGNEGEKTKVPFLLVFRKVRLPL